MELRLLSARGVREGSLLSIKVGTKRSIVPFSAEALRKGAHRLGNVSSHQQLKLDVYEPVAHARLLVEPAEARWDVPLAPRQSEETGDLVDGTSSSSVDGAISLEFEMQSAGSTPRRSGDGKEEQGSEPPKADARAEHRHRAAIAIAKTQPYFEQHGLITMLQGLVQAVIKEKPPDPYAYMVQVLQNSSRATAGQKSRTQGGQTKDPPVPAQGCPPGSTGECREMPTSTTPAARPAARPPAPGGRPSTAGSCMGEGTSRAPRRPQSASSAAARPEGASRAPTRPEDQAVRAASRVQPAVPLLAGRRPRSALPSMLSPKIPSAPILPVCPPPASPLAGRSAPRLGQAPPAEAAVQEQPPADEAASRAPSPAPARSSAAGSASAQPEGTPRVVARTAGRAPPRSQSSPSLAAPVLTSLRPGRGCRLPPAHLELEPEGARPVSRAAEESYQASPSRASPSRASVPSHRELNREQGSQPLLAYTTSTQSTACSRGTGQLLSTRGFSCSSTGERSPAMHAQEMVEKVQPPASVDEGLEELLDSPPPEASSTRSASPEARLVPQGPEDAREATLRTPWSGPAAGASWPPEPLAVPPLPQVRGEGRMGQGKLPADCLSASTTSPRSLPLGDETCREVQELHKEAAALEVQREQLECLLSRLHAETGCPLQYEGSCATSPHLG